jgi:hypothetical protein
MASVNKRFSVEKGLEVGDQALFVDADNNRTGVGKTDPSYGLDVALTANFDGIVAAGQIGIGSTQPIRDADFRGTVQFYEELYDVNNSAGNNGQVLRSVGTAVSWTDLAEIQVNAAGTDFQVQYRRTDGKFGGANQLYYNPVTNRVGIGTSFPEYLFQTKRPRDDSSNGYVQIGGTFLDAAGSVGAAGSVLGANSDGELVWVGAGTSEFNVIFVTEDGNDGNDGRSPTTAKRSVKAACGIATAGQVIRITGGVYPENNPILVPKNITIDGDDLRNTQIIPTNIGQDLFYVDNGDLLQNMSFIGAANTAAMIAFNPASNTGIITQSPYIRNCTNFVPDSIGMKIDGNHAEGTKSMVCDSYTQYNQGGVGVSITNDGYAQLVSIFTICCDRAISCYSGGSCDLNNSNASFGNIGLIASGIGTVRYTGILTTPAIVENNVIEVSGLGSERPFTGQVLYIGELFNTVKRINVTSSGAGYTSANPPRVTIGSPSGPNGITAEGVAVVSGFGSVTAIDLVSTGNQYRTPPLVTIAAPNVGFATATATAEIEPAYFTINSATTPTAGVSTITLDQNLPSNIGVGSTVPFAKQSLILASSYTFEYIGSGTTIATAFPSAGGVSIPENMVISEEGGIVVYTSTDEKGNFRIGDGFTINQQTGTITGDAFNKSIQATLTPLIIALGQG